MKSFTDESSAADAGRNADFVIAQWLASETRDGVRSANDAVFAMTKRRSETRDGVRVVVDADFFITVEQLPSETRDGVRGYEAQRRRKERRRGKIVGRKSESRKLGTKVLPMNRRGGIKTNDTSAPSRP